MLNVFMKLSYEDRRVIVQCMRLLLDVDDDALAHYGLTCQLVNRVYDNWITASGWPGGIA
jgi:hypothetical protein